MRVAVPITSHESQRPSRPLSSASSQPSLHLIMSLSRLPLLRTSLTRSLHTSTIRSFPASTSTPLDSTTAAPPTSLSEPHAADAVAGKITGPITERLSAGEITAETISGAPSACCSPLSASWDRERCRLARTMLAT